MSFGVENNAWSPNGHFRRHIRGKSGRRCLPEDDDFMRISIVLPNLAGGGVERVRLLLAEEFLKRGHAVDLVLMQYEGELLDEIPLGCRVIRLKTPRFRYLWLALHKYFRRERPDAVLAAMWPLTAISGLALRTSRIPAKLVVSEHNDFRYSKALNRPLNKRILKYFGRFLYSPASSIIAVSNGVAESLQQRSGINRSKLTVVHNPVRVVTELEPSGPDNEVMDWWKGGDSRILAVGSFKEQKSFDVLLHAHAKLCKRSDARLVILGEGRLRPSLEALIRNLGLESSVKLPGFRNNPYPFYLSADVFVLSSSWEGFGVVIVEALACGTPVVSTDCPSGPAEILENGRFGRLVPVGDVDALTKAIRATVHNPPNRAMLRERAEDFNPAIVASKYLAPIAPNGVVDFQPSPFSEPDRST